jgi:hypothetical protein
MRLIYSNTRGIDLEKGNFEKRNFEERGQV